VYLLHFSPPYRHARHYLGWTEGPVTARLATHLAGAGSPLVAAAVAAGCAVDVVRTIAGDRHLERRIKRARCTPDYCPICRPPRRSYRLL
jgi:hypothetical protein